MVTPLRLMAVLAHPDDESLGMGGTLVKYAAECRESGRSRGIPPGEGHPGAEELGRIRKRELEAAAATLGIRELALLGYHDQQLDRADPREAIGRIAAIYRGARPQVVMTFGPEGGYGHPDHIAISQFALAAAVMAADSAWIAPDRAAPHAISKFYFMAWPRAAMAAYEEAFRKLISRVDGVEREANAWPDWAVTTVIDTRTHWQTVWRAVSCHESQITAYEKLSHLTPSSHEALWGWQSYYRVFSTVNGGRGRESDLFEGLR